MTDVPSQRPHGLRRLTATARSLRRPGRGSGCRRAVRRHCFTLAECLAAIAVTVIVMPVAVRALLVTARSAELARRGEEANRLAAMQLREWIVTDEWQTADEQGDFGDDHPGYAWELQTEDWDQDDDTSTSMTLVTVLVTYSVQGHAMTTSVSTLEPGSE